LLQEEKENLKNKESNNKKDDDEKLYEFGTITVSELNQQLN
jgi:hypothetical protein